MPDIEVQTRLIGEPMQPAERKPVAVEELADDEPPARRAALATVSRSTRSGSGISPSAVTMYTASNEPSSKGSSRASDLVATMFGTPCSDARLDTCSSISD